MFLTFSLVSQEFQSVLTPESLVFNKTVKIIINVFLYIDIRRPFLRYASVKAFCFANGIKIAPCFIYYDVLGKLCPPVDIFILLHKDIDHIVSSCQGYKYDHDQSSDYDTLLLCQHLTMTASASLSAGPFSYNTTVSLEFNKD